MMSFHFRLSIWRLRLSILSRHWCKGSNFNGFIQNNFLFGFFCRVDSFIETIEVIPICEWIERKQKLKLNRIFFFPLLTLNFVLIFERRKKGNGILLIIFPRIRLRHEAIGFCFYCHWIPFDWIMSTFWVIHFSLSQVNAFLFPGPMLIYSRNWLKWWIPMPSILTTFIHFWRRFRGNSIFTNNNSQRHHKKRASKRTNE